MNSSVSDAGTSKSLVTSSGGSEFTEEWMDNRSSSGSDLANLNLIFLDLRTSAQ